VVTFEREIEELAVVAIKGIFVCGK